MNRLACAIVLAGTALLGAVGQNAAYAAPSQGALQLSIISPDAGSIADRVALDVSFRGGNVERVELYLDGNLAAQRQLNTAQPRGVITFSLDAVQLTEGSHDVLVKAYGSEGKPATAFTRIKIPGADLASPVRIANPQNGLVVSGVISIRVTLASELQKEKPYVSFFVDKEFKSLKNYPPYEYNWDTTKVPNGWHVLEAMTATPDAATPTKARSIHVNVNNPGGQTAKLDAIQDLGSRKPVPIADPLPVKVPGVRGGSKIGASPATTSGGIMDFTITAPKGVSIPRADKRPVGFGGAKSTEPTMYNGGKTAAAPGTIPVSVRSANVNGPRPKTMGLASQVPNGQLKRGATAAAENSVPVSNRTAQMKAPGAVTMGLTAQAPNGQLKRSATAAAENNVPVSNRTAQMKAPGPVTMGLTAQAPNGQLKRGVTAAAENSVPVSNRTARVKAAGPVTMGLSAQEPKGGLGKPIGRRATLPVVSDPGVVVLFIRPSSDVTGNLTKSQPGATVESIARQTGHSVAELRALNGIKKGQALPKTGPIIVPRSGSFDVAFDGTQIAFDVPPRIEGGIKLAPFRQIFEHSGGRLYWFNSVKTVRAVNSSREIELKIGDANALVNNQTLTMERKPFIETGRTIVPLTFIRDALNVKISYDEKSGRLLIESNK